MKKRIKIDSAILSSVIILTGLSFLFKDIYLQSALVENILDFVGVIVILKGTFIRMVARGHKKANSERGGELVVDGLYVLTRNPMYLGSFLMGCGFVLILWPWWCLPLFAVLFYLRFNRQMVKEEQHLTKLFEDKYASYCKKVPRIFPKPSKMLKVKPKEIIRLDEAMDTKEARGLITWPAAAFVFELFQQVLLLGYVDIYQTFVLFAAAIIVFNVGFIVIYQSKG